MMTFVNMYSPGLRILATHRVLRSLEKFGMGDLLAQTNGRWSVHTFDSIADLKRAIEQPKPKMVRIGVVTVKHTILLERPRERDEMDVPVLHNEIIGKWLGISEEAVRDEKYIHYVRGIDAAVAEVRERGGQVAFLLDPLRSTTWRASRSPVE